ncbi:hypothetical protein GCM10027289_29540 [Tsukamurella serpentis]
MNCPIAPPASTRRCIGVARVGEPVTAARLAVSRWVAVMRATLGTRLFRTVALELRPAPGM